MEGVTNVPDETTIERSPPGLETQAAHERSTARLLLAAVRPNAAVTIALAFAMVVVSLFAVYIFARPIVLLLAGIIIAQALIPIVNFLNRWVPRALAIASTYIALLLLLILAGIVIVPSLVDQGQELVDRAPELYEDAMAWLVDKGIIAEEISTDEVGERVTGWISQFGGRLVEIPLTIVSTVADVVLVVATSIYWLIAGPSMRRFTLSLFPAEQQGRTDSILTEIGQTMGGYVRGIAINSTLVGIASFIILSLLGIEYALVLALIAGLLDIVPIVGPVVATVPIVGVALLESLTLGLITLGIWIVIQQVENYVTMPFIMRQQAEIPPLLVLLAIFWGGSVGGILGALVAIPLSGALRVIFIRIVAPAIRRWTGAIEGDLIGPPQPPASQHPA